MHSVKTKLVCPKCGFPVDASFKKRPREFLLFICPDCHSNVVYYNKKMDTISNELVAKLINNKKIRFCGMVDVFNTHQGKRQPLTKEDVTNVKIALESSASVDDFLKNLT